MFAIRSRRSSRRPSRFVPVVDGLQRRIAPVCEVPMDCDISDPEPTQPAPDPIPTPAPTRQAVISPKMERTWAAIDEMLIPSGAQI